MVPHHQPDYDAGENPIIHQPKTTVFAMNITPIGDSELPQSYADCWGPP